MTYLDNRGLFEQRRPRTAMSDTLHELDHLMPPMPVKRPPAWPRQAWPRFIYRWLARRHMRRWFPEGQPVRLTEFAFAGRAGVIVGVTYLESCESWYLNVKLYGGVVGAVDYVTQILVTCVEWLSPDEARQAKDADRAMVNASRLATMREAAMQDAKYDETPATPRDGIIHPHRRLQV